jgi:chromate transporter
MTGAEEKPVTSAFAKPADAADLAPGLARASKPPPRSRLREVAAVFLKLGVIGFGGPAAHIALMEEEVVTRRRWMSRQHFLDLVGATNLIPGPNSTEMTMHCGHERAGIAGLFVAGASFILPAVLLVGVLAHLYVTFGELPQVEPYLYGIKPAILAVILGAVYKLGKKAIKGWALAVLGLAVVVAALLGLSEVLAVLAAGVTVLVLRSGRRHLSGGAAGFGLLLPGILQTSVAATVAASPEVTVTATRLFLVLLKIGAVLFGSGYVLVAYLDGELVQNLGWLTRAELLDAIAVGQFTPGPLLATATFVGYQIDGVTGALAATAGIFLPSFLFVSLLNPLVPRLRRSRWAAAMLDGVNAGAVAVMAAVTLILGRDILVDWQSWTLAILGAVAVFGPRKIHPVWLVLGGAVLGAVLR